MTAAFGHRGPFPSVEVTDPFGHGDRGLRSAGFFPSVEVTDPLGHDDRSVRSGRPVVTVAVIDRFGLAEQAKLPRHDFEPLGYVVQQHLARVDRPVSGYAKWANQIPSSYVEHVLEGDATNAAKSFDEDPNCIFTIKHMASLAPTAQLAGKPMFDLKQADGIGGGQIQAVARCRADFTSLTRKLLAKLGIALPVVG